MKTTGVHHICIRVQDQELSRRWYENVLGFECVELQPSKGPGCHLARPACFRKRW